MTPSAAEVNLSNLIHSLDTFGGSRACCAVGQRCCPLGAPFRVYIKARLVAICLRNVVVHPVVYNQRSVVEMNAALPASPAA